MERFQHALVGRASSTVHLVETSGFVADSSRSYAKLLCRLRVVDMTSPTASSLGNRHRAGNAIQCWCLSVGTVFVAPDHHGPQPSPARKSR